MEVGTMTPADATIPRWTQTIITDLRARLAEGQSVEFIAAALDRSTADVGGMMGRLRLQEARPDGRTR